MKGRKDAVRVGEALKYDMGMTAKGSSIRGRWTRASQAQRSAAYSSPPLLFLAAVQKNLILDCHGDHHLVGSSQDELASVPSK